MLKAERVVEVGVAVKNLEATVKLWTELLGAVPAEPLPVDQHGNRCQICRVGITNFRFMQAARDNEVARIIARRKNDCLFHVGLQVPDLNKALAWMKQNNIKMTDVTPRTEDGVKFAFVDPVAFNDVPYKLMEGKQNLKYKSEAAQKKIAEKASIKRVLEVAVNASDVSASAHLLVRAFGMRACKIQKDSMFQMWVNMNRVDDIDFEVMASFTPEGVIARSIAKIGEGLAHIALLVNNIDDCLDWMKQHNVRLIDQTPKLPESKQRVAFIHPSAFNGVMFELIEGLCPWFEQGEL